MVICLLLGCFAWGATPRHANADEFRPAYLELRQVGAETYDVLWKVPAIGGQQRLALSVRLPEASLNVVEPRGAYVGSSHVERWQVRRPGGLHGQEIAIEGLQYSAAEVLVRVESADGSAQVTRLTASRPSFKVALAAGPLAVAQTYTVLGIEHILLGADHLLFVFALLVLVRGGRRIVLTITAFTVAHSVTLAAATFGWLTLPPAPVEAVIALSIAFLAREIVVSWRGQPSLTERKPWLVAFTFGLLHGLGFAGALAEIGLPEKAVPLALLSFNLGVEAGQLLFVAGVLALAFLSRQLLALGRPVLKWIPPYAIGGAASYWLIARVAAFAQ
ncbi:MAG: HupE/UreJ family protein [Burkholderiales bacterium]|nr:HupE/UreJ family protein [Burkholderiales bacterium]